MDQLRIRTIVNFSLSFIRVLSKICIFESCACGLLPSEQNLIITILLREAIIAQRRPGMLSSLIEGEMWGVLRPWPGVQPFISYSTCLPLPCNLVPVVSRVLKSPALTEEGASPMQLWGHQHLSGITHVSVSSMGSLVHVSPGKANTSVIFLLADKLVLSFLPSTSD